MNQYLKDIFDQPAILRKAFGTYSNDNNKKMIHDLAQKKFKKVMFSGMGGSHYACYASSIYLTQHGIQSEVKSAGGLLHYESKSIDEGTLLFLISQSGESAEIVHLMSKIPDACTVVAITNNPQSTLAKRGNYTFILDVPDEEAVATRTYLSSIMLLGFIAKSMVGTVDKAEISKFQTALDHLEKFLNNDFEEMKEKIDAFIGLPSYLCLTGRGFSYSSVLAGGLFIREVGKFPCISIDSGEFRHGPFELIDQNFTGILLAPDGPTYDIHCKLAMDIAKREGKVLLITNRATNIQHPGIMVIELEQTDEFLSPFVDIVPIQIVANNIAERKGLEVGKFRWSSKVVESE